MMEEYSKWCDEEANEKEDAITSHKRTIGDLASESELVNTVDSLERALVVLKRGQSFLQARDQDDMKDKAEATLSDARKAEMEANHEYEMLKQNLETQIKTMKKRMSEATTQKSGLEDAKASAEEELASTKKTLADDEKYLVDLKQSCSMKAQEWATRQKDAAEELAAIAKAKEVLESGVKVFLEVSSKTHSKNDEISAKRDRVVSILSKLEDHSYFFTQIKSEARAGGPFDKVKGLIEDMITRLEKEAA